MIDHFYVEKNDFQSMYNFLKYKYCIYTKKTISEETVNKTHIHTKFE